MTMAPSATAGSLSSPPPYSSSSSSSSQRSPSVSSGVATVSLTPLSRADRPSINIGASVNYAQPNSPPVAVPAPTAAATAALSAAAAATDPAHVHTISAIASNGDPADSQSPSNTTTDTTTPDTAPSHPLVPSTDPQVSSSLAPLSPNRARRKRSVVAAPPPLPPHLQRQTAHIARHVRALYGLTGDERGHTTIGHGCLTVADRLTAQQHKSDLLYGEVLPEGASRMFDEDHLDLASVRSLFDLGAGLGKLVVQAFLQFPNLDRVCGVELAESRCLRGFDALRMLGQWRQLPQPLGTAVDVSVSGRARSSGASCSRTLSSTSSSSAAAAAASSAAAVMNTNSATTTTFTISVAPLPTLTSSIAVDTRRTVPVTGPAVAKVSPNTTPRESPKTTPATSPKVASKKVLSTAFVSPSDEQQQQDKEQQQYVTHSSWSSHTFWRMLTRTTRTLDVVETVATTACSSTGEPVTATMTTTTTSSTPSSVCVTERIVESPSPLLTCCFGVPAQHARVRSLELFCGDLFTMTEAWQCDVVVCETKFPEDRFPDVCAFFRRFKRTVRLLTYEDLDVIYTACAQVNPFERVPINRSVNDRFYTTWAPTYGCRFHMWRFNEVGGLASALCDEKVPDEEEECARVRAAAAVRPSR